MVAKTIETPPKLRRKVQKLHFLHFFEQTHVHIYKYNYKAQEISQNLRYI